MGTGSPTVILESGLSGSAFEWGYVQPAAAQRRRVCSYDRAGLGYSEPGPRPRTSGRMVRELATLLDTAGIHDRVVLVGHSFGGFNVRLFAYRHPERVAALVLTDTSHEDQRRRFAEAHAPTGEMPDALPYLIPTAARLGITRLVGFGTGLTIQAIPADLQRYVNATRFQSDAVSTAAAEYLALEDSAAELRTARRQLTVPVMVLVRTWERHPVADRVWRDLQADHASISPFGCRTFVNKAGHLIPSERPDAVLVAIDAAVTADREHRPPVCPSRL